MQTFCIVPDTNVVVSAHLNATGHERLVLDLAQWRRIRIAVSANISAEYEGVLRGRSSRLRPSI